MPIPFHVTFSTQDWTQKKYEKDVFASRFQTKSEPSFQKISHLFLYA